MKAHRSSLLAFGFASGTMFTGGCELQLRDALVEGVSQFITQSTVDLLTSLSPLQADTTDPDLTDGSPSDPFDPPIQS